MSGGKLRWLRLCALTVMAAAILAPVFVNAQGGIPGGGAPGTIPGMGGMTSASSQPINYGGAPGQSPDAAPAPDYESVVSFIDSAIPMSQVKMIIDGNYGDHRPTRAEYLFPKSGVPGNPGWYTPEKNVDWQELRSYVEMAYKNVFSAFLELPTRWVNPDVNPNEWGMTDIQGGVKVALLNSPGMATTFELRGTFPTRTGPGLSTSHYSVEPGLLFFLRPLDWLAVEGELRYWKPINGTDFAGDLARYGLGFSIGERKYDDSFWFTPVVEIIGWTAINGKEMVPMPDGPVIRGIAGETIVNG
ncbi:MAG TPA: hypothetical protein VE988_16200, partial [Gemmataceae bacterium]|nr:hypothetical protein [Gemmataceae bacterium]